MSFSCVRDIDVELKSSLSFIKKHMLEKEFNFLL